MAWPFGRSRRMKDVEDAFGCFGEGCRPEAPSPSQLVGCLAHVVVLHGPQSAVWHSVGCHAVQHELDIRWPKFNFPKSFSGYHMGASCLDTLSLIWHWASPESFAAHISASVTSMSSKQCAHFQQQTSWRGQVFHKAWDGRGYANAS